MSGVRRSSSTLRTVSFNSHRSFLGQIVQRSVTPTWRWQMSCGPHSSILWQVRQPCGCSAIRSSITSLRRSVTCSVFEFTTRSGATGAVQEATIPFLPPISVSTTQALHAPYGFIFGK